MRSLIRVALAVVVLGSAATAPAGTVTFVDTVVNPASYTTSIYRSDATVTIAALATALGNPGPALELHFSNAGGPVDLLSTEGFINATFAYNPSLQGAIQTVDFSSDRYVDFGAALNPSLSVSSRVLILQNGSYYFASFVDPQVRGAFYTSAANGFSALDFGLFDFATGAANPLLHPDFSATGSMIAFGFASRFNLTTATPFALDGSYRFDNISVRVNAIPEPPMLWLLALGVIGAATAARRRKA